MLNLSAVCHLGKACMQVTSLPCTRTARHGSPPACHVGEAGMHVTSCQSRLTDNSRRAVAGLDDDHPLRHVRRVDAHLAVGPCASGLHGSCYHARLLCAPNSGRVTMLLRYMLTAESHRSTYEHCMTSLSLSISAAPGETSPRKQITTAHHESACRSTTGMAQPCRPA